MTEREAFEAWAPPEMAWSAWAKPTLFVHPPRPIGTQILGAPGAPTPGAATGPTPFESPLPAPHGADGSSDELAWPRLIPGHSALVLEMPGPLGVESGIALRDRGYWPVPLYNATPGFNAFVDVGPTVRALHDGAPRLRGRFDPAALPCFLLDINRCPAGLRRSPGRYDNRSVVFPQDFPSAILMRSRGVEQVVVVSHGSSPSAGGADLATDLAHVLHGWERDGLRILRMTATSGKPPVQISVPKPKGFGLAWRRLITFAGFRRSAVGGFGSLIPEASTGGGYS